MESLLIHSSAAPHFAYSLFQLFVVDMCYYWAATVQYDHQGLTFQGGYMLGVKVAQGGPWRK